MLKRITKRQRDGYVSQERECLMFMDIDHGEATKTIRHAPSYQKNITQELIDWNHDDIGCHEVFAAGNLNDPLMSPMLKRLKDNGLSSTSQRRGVTTSDGRVLDHVLFNPKNMVVMASATDPLPDLNQGHHMIQDVQILVR